MTTHVRGGAVLVAVVAATSTPARAQERPLPVGAAGVHPLRLVPLAGALPAGTWQLGSSLAYGRSAAVTGTADVHHRAAGGVAIERWFRGGLGFGVSLDGRYDRHVEAHAGPDDGWTGDPRLHGRFGRELHAAPAMRVDAGALASVWLPGGDAPSIDPSAITPEASGLLGVTTAGGFTIGSRVGARLDRSAQAAPDAARLSAADRASIGASQANAALLGVSATIRRERWAAFAEWAWDLLLGADAPPARESPMRVAAGLEAPVGDALAISAGAAYAVSRVPGYVRGAPGAPLVAMPPELLVGVGLIARWGGGASDRSPPSAMDVEPTRAPAPPEPEPAPAAPVAPGQLRATVASPSGRKLDGTLQLTRVEDGASAAAPQPRSFERGEFRVDVQPGEYELVVEVRGYAVQRRRVTIDENGVTVLNLVLAGAPERRR